MEVARTDNTVLAPPLPHLFPVDGRHSPQVVVAAVHQGHHVATPVQLAPVALGYVVFGRRVEQFQRRPIRMVDEALRAATVFRSKLGTSQFLYC